MAEGIQGVQNSSYNSLQDSSKSAAKTQKDEFLRLLTYQLKSQNPLSPYDNQEFATQLAQFSQLEQLSDIRSLLEEQVQTNLLLTQTISNTALPGLLGKNARAMSDEVYFDGENSVKIGYNLAYASNSGELIIKDSAGKEIRRLTIAADELGRGDHDIIWDGTDADGNAVALGTYSVEAVMKDGNGTTFNADTYTSGRIEGVKFKAEGTMIVINGMEIPLQYISDITT
jgi:flagellar basal-body rod modification protein FlgD